MHSALETRLLEMFLVLTEHRHYGRAARAAGVTQPALSQYISQLERLTRCQLFERTTRSVELTSAGLALRPKIDQLLLELRALGQTGERYRRAVAGELLMGVPRCFGGTAARAWLASQPGASAQVLSSAALVRAVRAGDLDGGVGYQTDAMGAGPGLCRSAPIVVESRLVVLPGSHRLADRSSVTVADLAHERAIDLDVSVFGSERALWTEGLGAAHARRPVTNIEELFDALTLKQGLCLAPESEAVTARAAGFVAVPVTDVEPVALGVFWRAGEQVPSFTQPLPVLWAAAG